jgi:hypothetical protein
MKQFRIIAPDLPGFGQSDLPNRDKLKFYYTFDNITRVIDRTAVRKGPPSLPPHLVPLKTLRPGTKESKKYDQIVRSIRAIGLIEAPVVAAGGAILPLGWARSDRSAEGSRPRRGRVPHLDR